MMRVLSSLSLVVLLSTLGAPTSALGAELFLKAGLIGAGISFDAPEDFEGPELQNRLGLVLGLDLALRLSSTFALQPGLTYVNKGARQDIEATIDGWFFEGTSTIKLDYIEAPVMLRFSPTGAANNRPFFLIGSTIGYNIDSVADLQLSPPYNLADRPRDIEESMDLDAEKDMDISLVAGVGIDSGNLSIEVRYSHGLTSNSINQPKLKDTEPQEDPVRLNIKSRALMVVIGLKF